MSTRKTYHQEYYKKNREKMLARSKECQKKRISNIEVELLDDMINKMETENSGKMLTSAEVTRRLNLRRTQALESK